ncbi:MAG: 16S rRNA (cytosine(1402)-N(4))-methyltransferase RsmH [candidate division Zixibacteria bacterium]|nr:16S rRNA (cytosine(1402)-N(4))-methyltransferase RsmH [candidate division Zixibacteria bacterium]
MRKLKDEEVWHKPVLLERVIEFLITDKSGIYVDATIGTGGHAERILRELNENGKLIGIDKDEDSLKISEQRLRRFGKKVIFFHQSYIQLPEILKRLSLESIKGLLLDLGLSSYQLEKAERGFSYSLKGPLDMRFDQKEVKSALQVVNGYPFERLKKIFRDYGEERYSSRIAQAIVQNRKVKKIDTTKELKDIIQSILRTKNDEIKTLSRVFQALRIEVNTELIELKEGLENGIKALAANGRICVLSYHSLEDRMVKEKFNMLARGCVCPPGYPVCVCGGKKSLMILTRKPITAEVSEIIENPKARSAKLRAAEKIV